MKFPGRAFLLLALHSPTGGLVLLVGLKVALDLHAHLAERRKFRENLEVEPA